MDNLFIDIIKFMNFYLCKLISHLIFTNMEFIFMVEYSMYFQDLNLLFYFIIKNYFKLMTLNIAKKDIIIF